MRPLIVITLGARTRPEVKQQYRDYVSAAGAYTLVLLPGDPVPSNFDGLLLGGGADIDPSEYGAEAAGTRDPEPERDAYERPIAERALAERVPVLGICRGLQLLNVLYGGTLTQDLPDHPRPARHRVDVASDSALARMLGKSPVEVNSSHHQGVRSENLAPRLRATAATDDGVIEGVEGTGPAWVVGVQWHPERVAEVDSANRGIAEAFVAAAQAYAERRAPARV